MEKKTQTKKIVIAVIALIAAIAILTGGYFIFRPKAIVGAKTITVSVVDAAKTQTDLTVKTDAEMLGQALLDNKIIEGDVGEFGIFITKVNGITADDTKSEWWCITKGGEMVNTSADTTPIADGEKYELTLSTY